MFIQNKILYAKRKEIAFSLLHTFTISLLSSFLFRNSHSILLEPMKFLSSAFRKNLHAVVSTIGNILSFRTDRLRGNLKLVFFFCKVADLAKVVTENLYHLTKFSLSLEELFELKDSKLYLQA